MRLAVLGALPGCAGVFAEVAATSMGGATFEPDSGADMDVEASTVTFTAGVEFGSTRQRFAMGYMSDALSSDAGDSTTSGGMLRYDRQVVGIGERLGVRLGAALEFGNSDEGSGNAVTGMLGATYYLTWRTPVHLMVGARVVSADLPTGSLRGTGLTVRAGVSYHLSDPRPDTELIVPLDTARVLTGKIESRATSLGCTTRQGPAADTFSSVFVRCDGRDYEFFQIANGMMVTCKRQPSKARCDDEVSRILRGREEPEPTRVPEATPATAPAPTPTPTPTPTPEAAPAPAPTPDAAPAPDAAPVTPAPPTP